MENQSHIVFRSLAGLFLLSLVAAGAAGFRTGGLAAGPERLADSVTGLVAAGLGGPGTEFFTCDCANAFGSIQRTCCCDEP